MNITSKYSIQAYPGRQSLNLMNMPSSVSGDAPSTAEYNLFLEGVSTIYGTQSDNGAIPVFWSMFSGGKYVGNPDSTLTSLSPKQSYYFIAKDETYLPLKIPVVGGYAAAFADQSQLPSVKISGNKTLVGNGNNYSYLTFDISGLVPYEEYSYTINSLHGNWPAIIYPSSGRLKSSDASVRFDAALAFCKTTGDCAGNSSLLNYSLDPQGIDYDNLYSIINFELNPVSYNGEGVTSDSFTINCKDCLPKVKIGNPASTTLNTTNVNYYTFTSTISGLKPNTQYSYLYRTINSNWPTLLVSKSGTFTATDKVYDLSTKLLFCPSTELCPSGTQDLMSYNIGGSTDSRFKRQFVHDQISTTFDLLITNLDDNSTYVSEPSTIRCQNCLSSASGTYHDITFSVSELALNVNCCSGTTSLVAIATGVVPGDDYTYSFTSTNSGVSFTPNSGVIYFGANASGNINTIMSHNLINNEKAVVQVSLVHRDSAITAFDFVTIKCGSC